MLEFCLCLLWYRREGGNQRACIPSKISCIAPLFIICILPYATTLVSNRVIPLGEGQADLFLEDGSNPCELLKNHCKSSVPSHSYEQCFKKLHPIVIEKLIAIWDEIYRKIDVNESFFISCEPLHVKYDDIDFQLGLTLPERISSVSSSGNRSDLFNELFAYIERAKRDTLTLSMQMQALEHRENELKLTDTVKLELYRKFILLLPNNSFIVAQFGMALMYAGREDLAKKLFEHAVARNLWTNPMQRPLFIHDRSLDAIPWHDNSKFSFVQTLQNGYLDIKEELMTYLQRERSQFSSNDSGTHHIGGDWKRLVLKSYYTGNLTEHCEYFPITMKHIEKCDFEFVSIVFSLLTPGTHIRAHTGPSNAKLRVHLTLIHTGGAFLRVGNEWRTWEEGKVLVFDSSWEHEVKHIGNDPRVVLIIDIWHPDVPPERRIAQ